MDKKEIVQKLSTGIKGLNELFYGGIHLQPFHDNRQAREEGRSLRANDGIIIMIRGPRGINKIQLAMQMMHGLTRDLYSIGDCMDASPLFYSLNKDTARLENMLLDLLISKQVNTIIRENASGRGSQWHNDLLGKSLFDLQTLSLREYGNDVNGLSLPADYKECIDRYLCDRTIYYNTRTNALHFKRLDKGDANDNMLFYRFSDRLADYCRDNKGALGALPKEMRDDFFYVDFNHHESSDGGDWDYYYSRTVLQIFDLIVDDIARERANKSRPCLVVDGFAELSSEDLARLPLSHLERSLRETARVSILVFDERGKNVKCNADIIIDMRRKEEPENAYTYHELQISKCVFQSVSYGWHQYKLRDAGLEVFPSIHRLLQRRHYLAHILLNTYESILHDSYSEYMRAEKITSSKPDYSYKTYQEKQRVKEDEFLKEMYHRQVENRKHTEKIGMDILKRIILGQKGEASEKNNRLARKEITALVGNPNSFKRFIVNAGIFNASCQKKHTLVILFDKEEPDMRRQIICPGFRDKENVVPCFEDESKYENRGCAICNLSCKLRKCRSCYDYIHFFGVRTGCISADELFAVIKEQVELPFSDGQKISRVIVDDLQKIDYSFPFLRKESLFLTAFVALCREYNLETMLLCDKNASLTDPLCSLADNVVCLKREWDDYDSLTLYVERDSEHVIPSGVYRYEIQEISNSFSCGEDRVKLDENAGKISCKQIGSMRDYWRKKLKVFTEEDKNEGAADRRT